MRYRRRWVALVPLIVVVMLAACQEVSSEEHATEEPYRLESVDGTDLSRVILTERAAQRLGIQAASVETGGDGSVIPAAAVLYDPNGEEWVYTSPEPLVFVRHAITVDRFKGGIAVLSDGPPAGTEVVIVGAAELYGAESGVGN